MLVERSPNIYLKLRDGKTGSSDGGWGNGGNYSSAGISLVVGDSQSSEV